MNILAHAYLSERHAPWLIGNFIGDFIKGDPAHPRHGLTTGEVAGVRLHRAIDAFTDAHPDVAAVRTLLYPRCHKYAGVAVDVFFDYQLAVTFAPLTGESLPTFVADFYAVLQTHVQRLPAPARHMMEAMVRQNWVLNYRTTDGIDRSLRGIARRTAFASGLETAVDDLIRYDSQIQEHFNRFWPELVAHTQAVKAEL
ncbi:acyl carrier protein phosphodiesterase [Spirosoma luteolum]